MIRKGNAHSVFVQLHGIVQHKMETVYNTRQIITLKRVSVSLRQKLLPKLCELLFFESFSSLGISTLFECFIQIGIDLLPVITMVRVTV